MYAPYAGAEQYNQYGANGYPGMGPPGMAAPGTGAPFGMQSVDSHQQGRPGAFPPNFQPPTNINFSAPIIRLGGTARPDGPREDRDRGPRRAGLGAGPDYREKERPQPIQPQTKEEIIKTVFVGGITEGAGGDEGVQRILGAVGTLRKWFRATDADDKPCSFGFAEFEDPESLRTAIEVLKDVELPVKMKKEEEIKKEEDDEEDKIQKSRLLVIADENSSTYIEQWEESQGGVDTHHKQMLTDQAREALAGVLKSLELSRPGYGLSGVNGDTSMADVVKEENGDIITIQLGIDDELADIPAEMRATVAEEIKAFRDRSSRRDLERLKREEEIAEQEKSRTLNGRSRLGSPPATPTGHASTNGVPLGPRGSAPSGPKALSSSMPKDYQKNVMFINGEGISAASAFEDEETDASDDELERRRRQQKNAEHEKQYADQERRWLNRERSRTAAVEREKQREEDESRRYQEEQDMMAKRLREWDDKTEQARKRELFYADRGLWLKHRMQHRQREQAIDDADREQERREQARNRPDEYQSRRPEETAPTSPRRPGRPTSPKEPARFKLSLGAAAQRVQATQLAQASSKRTAAEVEGLLEDEEEEVIGTRRLVPIAAGVLDKAAASSMTEEERNEARKKLAQDIPSDKSGLWAWPVQWEYLDKGDVDVVEERLRPFIEKKIVEYLGVQEQMLVDVAVTALRERKAPGELVSELEGALDEEEAETLVKKLWRMVVFYSESEKRSLSM